MWQAHRPISMQVARGPEVNLPEGAGGRACTPSNFLSDVKRCFHRDASWTFGTICVSWTYGTFLRILRIFSIVIYHIYYVYMYLKFLYQHRCTLSRGIMASA